MGMALHELCTNAVKYGAWSQAGGVTLSVEARSSGMINIVWREAGGPRVREPARRGFGTRLLRQGVARELGGTVSLDYRPTGLVCTILVPSSEKVRLTEPAAPRRVDLER
jgi:two-component sensor histidine kinase